LGALPNTKYAQGEKETIMSSEKIGLVSATGTSFEIIKTLVNGIKEVGGEEEDVRRILSDPHIREKIVKTLCSKTEVLWTGSVIIDQSKTYDERVEDYSMVVSNLRREYTIECKDRVSKIELVLLRFNRNIPVDEAANEVFKERNLNMAGLEELIALGLQHPHVAFKFGKWGAILATRDSEKGEKSYVEVPCLFWSNNIALSTHQFVDNTCYITPFLFVKSVESV